MTSTPFLAQPPRKNELRPQEDPESDAIHHRFGGITKLLVRLHNAATMEQMDLTMLSDFQTVKFLVNKADQGQ